MVSASAVSRTRTWTCVAVAAAVLLVVVVAPLADATAAAASSARVRRARNAGSNGAAGAADQSGRHSLHHRSSKHKENKPSGPRRTGVVQWSPSANKVFFTPSALTYTGHEDTVVGAWGVFADDLHSTGWGELTVTTSGKVPDHVQAYTAGYLEGALTAQRIYELFVVIHDVHAKKPEVGEFIRAQDRFIRTKIRAFEQARAAADKLNRAHGPRAAAPPTADIDAAAAVSAAVDAATALPTDDAHDAAAATEADSTPQPPPLERPLHDVHSISGEKGSAHADVTASVSVSGSGESATVSISGSSKPAAAAQQIAAPHQWTEFELVYWFNVKLIMAQFDGLLAGYNRHRDPQRTKALTVEDLWLVNNDGDILDIERAVSPGRVFSNPNAPAKQELIELLAYNSRCSVMVKWTENDLLAGHATWDDYNEMNRMYKFYQFKFGDPLHVSRLHSQRTHMSSYPGMIFSSDDFYVLDSGLVLLETTLNILNEKLYSLSDPQSTVMAWIRNIIANRLASNGAEWAGLFAHYNSGTYNNQWMIVDYNRFDPNAKTLKPGTLTLFEQIPGFTKSMDVTSVLQKERYWASYNRPFFAETNARSMFEHFATAEGNTQQEKELFTYAQCPRARLFAREAPDVNDLEDLKEVLRLNRYEMDPISAGCPGNAIAARYDLKPVGTADATAKCEVTALRANGATDAKVTNYALAQKLQAYAVAGPTDDDCEPFDWSKTKFKKPAGQPDVFDFDWKLMKFADTNRA